MELNKKDMKRIFYISVLAISLAFTASSCRENPLDSYSRVAPDRTKDEDDDPGGLGGKFASGFGTDESPYILKTEEHVLNMSAGLEPGEMIYFRLESDIDLSGHNWQPLNSMEPYNKFIDFDGNGHVIKNLSCDASRYASFFGVLCGSCRKTGFLNATIKGSGATGVIAGYIGIRSPESANFTGSIEECYASGTVSGSPAGGLVGNIGTAYNSSSSYIKDSYSAVDVSSKGNAGGIAGNLLKSGIISNTYAAGAVSGSGNTGGLAGRLEEGASVSSSISWNKSISGTGNLTWYASSGTITDCFAWKWIESEITTSLERYSNKELQEKASSWGEPWGREGKEAKGFPALAWQIKRGDVGDICGLTENTEPAPEPDIPTDPTPQPITEGNGSQETPYLIYNVGQLCSLKNLLVAGGKIYVRLENHINMSKVESWEPLNAAEPYDKEIDFNGNGKIIKNFSCHNIGYAGFFGVLYGSCRDLEFENAFVSNNSACGIIGGYIGTEGKPGIVRNISATGKVIVTATFACPVGGLASNAREAEIENCLVNVNVINKCSPKDEKAATGGIVGKTLTASDKIIGCTFSGNVSTEFNMKYTGGIVGWQSVAGAEISGCIMSGSVYGKNERVGGIVGHFQGGTLWGCKVSGSVKGDKEKVGGIAGITSSASIINRCSVNAEIRGHQFVGGIAGYCESALEISNCSSSGTIDNAAQISGGIIGELRKGAAVRNCYSDAAVAGWQVCGGIVGRACDGKWDVSSGYNNTVEKCLAWNTKITARRKNENGGSSGAVIGFGSPLNTYKDCLRGAAMVFEGSWTNKGLPVDQENSSPESPLSNGTSGTESTFAGFDYIYPYHGKASSLSASEAASTLGWDTEVWDLTQSFPKLKYL